MNVYLDLVTPELVRQFDVFEYRRPALNGEQVVPCRLRQPDASAQSPEGFPLLVWLHGFGESGVDNVAQLRWLDLIVDGDDAADNLFVLVVQDTGEDLYWPGHETSENGQDWIDVVLEITDCVLEEMPIDSARVYLSGVSLGGSRCWGAVTRCPDLFATVAPLASQGGQDLPLEKLTSISIWAFHNKGDVSAPIWEVRATVHAIQKLNGNVALTETTYRNGFDPHDCWTIAFRNYGLRDWLLAQRRRSENAPRPGHVSFRARWHALIHWEVWWPRLLPLGVVTAVVWVMRREFSKARK